MVVADDQLLFVDLLQSIISTRADDFKIVGVAHDGNEAREKVFALEPDIALLDIKMPGITGVELTKEIVAKLPQTKVIILTTFSDDEYVNTAIDHGASGYLLKNMPVDGLIASIRSIYRGGFIVSEKIAKKAMKKSMDGQHKKTDNKEPLTKRQQELAGLLSRREQEVYKLMVNGYNNDEISEMLFIASQTVKNHIRSIYRKIGVHNRSDIYNL
jgi:DNA-binding NarL/FixJ family response regulator